MRFQRSIPKKRVFGFLQLVQLVATNRSHEANSNAFWALAVRHTELTAPAVLAALQQDVRKHLRDMQVASKIHESAFNIETQI